MCKCAEAPCSGPNCKKKELPIFMTNAPAGNSQAIVGAKQDVVLQTTSGKTEIVSGSLYMMPMSQAKDLRDNMKAPIWIREAS